MRKLTHIVPGYSSQVGDGFFIRRPMPNGYTKKIGPWLLLDHAGPTEIAPSDTPKGVPEHPHRGFETVTLAISGEVEHEDSAGHSGIIHSNEVQWMTAGSGVVHKEMHSKAFTKQGGVLEMVQLWVNLPAKYKMTRPRYQAIKGEAIPSLEWAIPRCA